MDLGKCGAFANPLECVQVKAASGGRQWRRRAGRLVRVIDTPRGGEGGILPVAAGLHCACSVTLLFRFSNSITIFNFWGLYVSDFQRYCTFCTIQPDPHVLKLELPIISRHTYTVCSVVMQEFIFLNFLKSYTPTLQCYNNYNSKRAMPKSNITLSAIYIWLLLLKMWPLHVHIVVTTWQISNEFVDVALIKKNI